METIKTLEDFHQLVLFHLMDIKIPDYVQYIAMDADGELYGFNEEPRIGLAVWAVTRHSTLATLLMERIKLPVEINWSDCLWKL